MTTKQTYSFAEFLHDQKGIDAEKAVHKDYRIVAFDFCGEDYIQYCEEKGLSRENVELWYDGKLTPLFKKKEEASEDSLAIKKMKALARHVGVSPFFIQPEHNYYVVNGNDAYFVWTDEERKQDAYSIIKGDLGSRTWGLDFLMELTQMKADDFIRHSTDIIPAKTKHHYTVLQFDGDWLYQTLENTCGFSTFADALIEEWGYGFWINTMDGVGKGQEYREGEFFIYLYG